MDKIKVTIDGQTYDVDKGVALQKMIDEHYTGNLPVVCVQVDTEFHTFDKTIDADCTLKFLTYLDPIGNRIYQKGLMFLLVYAFKELYGYSESIKMCHPIDKGILVRTSCSVDEKALEKIKNKMLDIVNQKLRFEKCLVTRKDAKSYFESINFHNKAEVLLYNTTKYIELYKLGDLYDYFYSSIMPYDTSILDRFEFTHIDNHTCIFRFPTIENNGEIPEYIERDKIMKTFNFSYQLARRMEIFNINDFNRRVAEGKANDIVKLSEAVSSGNLLGLAKDIDDNRNSIKLVLIAGPSSSGKTTTSRKLAMYLKVFGFNPKYLSIDDYFLDREDTPKLPNGEYDFESIRAINLDLFNDHLTRLINGEEVSIPTFNFYKGQGEYLGKTLKLGKRDILIIEGLHAINEELTKSISKDAKYKVYVSPLSDLNIDDHNMISNSDVRLLRRIVRDNRTRGYTAEDTISKWQNVRDGETKYIFPYQNDVDFVYNSSFPYEIGVLKTFAEPLLYQIDHNSECYEEALRLLKFLGLFVGVPDNEIPSDSIFREFIGGSYFE
ncbi:MAG: hypothetical protein IJL74_03960 [Bacilli bacterium]|nr:hypothetical protein [Bacilli bacterium]